MKNSINRLLMELRKFGTVWRVIIVTSGVRWCNLWQIFKKSKTELAVIHWKECNMFQCGQITCAKYYELRYVFKKNWTSSKLAHLFDTASKFTLFSGYGLKDEKLIKKANLQENWNTQTILQYVEYFCQMSSKSTLLISSYTVSKLVRFFWDTVYSYSNTISTTTLLFTSCKNFI